jgi:hypothetical protein
MLLPDAAGSKIGEAERVVQTLLNQAGFLTRPNAIHDLSEAGFWPIVTLAETLPGARTWTRRSMRFARDAR